MNILKQLFLVFTLIFGYVSLNSDVEARSRHHSKKNKEGKHNAKKGKKGGNKHKHGGKKSKSRKKSRHEEADNSDDE